MAKYFDGKTEGVDCRSTDSILCNWCKVIVYRFRIAGGKREEFKDKYKDKVDNKAGAEAS
jgi:hypothetical protein